MSRGKVAALLALLVAAAVLAGVRQGRQEVGAAGLEAVEVPAEMGIATSVKVRVYRGGQLVAEQEKVGDRLLYNFWALVLNAFLGRYYSTPLTIYRADGSTFSQPEWELIISSTTSNPLLAIGFGSSEASVSFYDYEVPGLLGRVDVSSTAYSLFVNDTHIIVTANASWTASSAVTVASVGLYWKGYSYGSTSAFYVLIARDVLPSPISLQANDIVAATYTITIAFNKPPFLKNLAALIANYILGAKYYGKAVSYTTWGNTVVSAMDIGMDYYTSTTYDSVKEYLYVGITSDSVAYSPALYSVGILAESSSPVTVSWGYNSTHVWFSVPPVSFLLQNGGTVRGVFARIKNVDVDGSTSYNAQQVMVLFFPLDTPVTVSAGSGIKLNFTVYFRW
ncbi:MAG: hypothetical protein QXZ31_08300 [Thermofilaceae archaeon]